MSKIDQPKKLSNRENKGSEIAKRNNQINRIDETHYTVKSQNSDSLYHIVSTEFG